MLSQTKQPEEIDAMRRGGAILAEGLELMKRAARPGVSTGELAEIAAKHIEKNDATPAFLNYSSGAIGVPPFPSVACISLNDAVVHGIPSDELLLRDGDVLSLDLGVNYGGMIVDGAITTIVGEADGPIQDLINTTKKALYAGLKEVKDGCHTGDIGAAIQAVLDSKNYGIVRDLVGHGVGYSVHEDPNIPNFGKRGRGARLKSGMTVAIEPMATLGNHEVYVDSDGWTVRTKDSSTAAHFEHTVLVTKDGYEILTGLSIDNLTT